MKQPTHTIPSREEILGVFRDAGTPLDAATLARALRVKPAAQEVLGRRLNAMERDGQIRANGEGIYTLANGADFVAGRISAHRDGFGFVIPDDPGADLFLNDKEMQKVLHGDRVLARVTGVDRRGRPEGTIVEVVERANTHVIGRLLNEGGVWIVSPEDQRINQDILIAGSPGKAKAGQVVSVELIEQPARFQQPTGRIVEVLGELDDPGMEIEIAVRKFGVPHVFSPAALKQANRLPNEVVDADLVDRVDLRDVPLVTIDGEDARDFDDAVYCEPVKLGAADGFRLLVAIADVSHYVKPNDALDADAIERSTSVYFPRRVIPMLPEKLSNGLCSLNPAVDRLSLVCDMVVSAEGEVQAYQFYPAVIHSAARLTYNQVAEILANPQGEEAGRRPTIVPHLQNLNGVFQALLGARHERGAIDFETTETYIVCNAMGKIEKIIPRTRNDAHRLIEECMLAANVCAADLLIRHKHPGTFRIHATPTEEKLNQLRTFLKMTGLNLGGGLKPTAGDYAALMREIKERPDAALLQTMLLRSMQQAVYSPDNVGHFGLAYEAYAHFTSPIRRYPDLLTHRAIKAVLQGKKYEPKGIDLTKLNTTVSNAARKQMAKDKAEGKAKDEKDLTVWDALGVHCSANERRADEASRDVENWLKCYFMQDKLGESFTGTVAGVTTFGIFVQLDELYVEGLVHVTELGQDYFTYDEARHQLRGERTGKTYGLTDRVVVQVAKVDLEARKIDLVLAPEGEQTLQQPAAEQAQVREAPPAGRARDGAGAPASRQGAEAEEGRSSRSKRSRRGRRERAAAREAAALAATGEGGFDASIEPDSSEAGRRSPRGIPDKKLMQTLQAEEVRKAAPVPAQLPVTEQPAAAQAEEPAPGKRPRRGKKAQPQQPAAQLDAVRQEADVSPQAPAVVTQPEPVVQAADTAPPKRARRTKKGEAQGQQQPQPQPQQVERAAAQAPAAPAAQPEAAEVAAGAGTAKRSRRSKKEQAVAEPVQQPDLPAVQEAAPGAAAPAAPKRARRAKAEPAAPAAAEAAAPAIAPGTPAAPAAEAPAKPRRKRATAALAADAAPAAGAEPVAPAAAAPAALESAPAKSAARKPAAKKTGGTTSKTSSKKEK